MRAISMPRTSRTVIDETISPRASFSFTLLRRMSLGFTGPSSFLQLPQRIELRDVARWIDAGGDDGGAAGFDGGGEGVAEALLGLHHSRVGAEGGAQLLPIDATELDAVQRDALDLLLDADQADLLVVEHDDDDGKLLEPRRLQLGHRHQEATVAAEGHDGAIGMREPRTQRARDGIAHGS